MQIADSNEEYIGVVLGWSSEHKQFLCYCDKCDTIVNKIKDKKNEEE